MNLFNFTGIYAYLFIFLGRMVEVALSTLRIMFVSKGRKYIGALFGFFEIFLYVLIIGTVLNNIREDPIKLVVYCAAFSCGIVLGVTLENKMAIGLMSMQVVSQDKDAVKISVALRDSGFGVTLIDGHSVDGTPRELIFVQLRRKRVAEAKRIIYREDPCALISVSEVKSLSGAFIK
jgi:uncharacterized protein YebE (UPF0316 family)